MRTDDATECSAHFLPGCHVCSGTASVHSHGRQRSNGGLGPWRRGQARQRRDRFVPAGYSPDLSEQEAATRDVWPARDRRPAGSNLRDAADRAALADFRAPRVPVGNVGAALLEAASRAKR